MPRKHYVRRVLEIGAGFIPRKALDLALRHPKTTFTVVEKGPINKKGIAERLKESGKNIPSTIELLQSREGTEFLSQQPSDRFSHVYSHFLLNNNTRVQKLKLINQIYRTLRPGGRYFAVEDYSSSLELTRELIALGFQVSFKPLSATDLEKLGTDFSTIHSKLFTVAFRIYSAASPARQKELIEAMRKSAEHSTLQVEGSPPYRTGTIRSLERILSNINDISENMFVVIIAKKPRK